MSLGVQVAIKRVLPRRHGSESGRDLRVVECAVASARGSHRIRPGGAGRDGGLDSGAAKRRTSSRWKPSCVGDRHAGEGTGQRCAGAGSGAGDAAGSASAVLKAGDPSGRSNAGTFHAGRIVGRISAAAGWPRAVTHPRLPQIRACPTRAPGSSNDGLAAQRYTLWTTCTAGRGKALSTRTYRSHVIRVRPPRRLSHLCHRRRTSCRYRANDAAFPVMP